MNWSWTAYNNGLPSDVQVNDLEIHPTGGFMSAATFGRGAYRVVVNAPTSISAPPDLTVTKSHLGDFVQGQKGIIYTIVVSNQGAGPTTGEVQLLDQLPSGLVASAIGGSGWDCILSSLTCKRSDQLGPGAKYAPVTLTANVMTNAPPVIVNSATVSTFGDTNPQNNNALDSTIIRSPLTIATSALPDGQVGVPYSFQLTAGGGTPPYIWQSIGGRLPPTLLLDSSGRLSGVPASAQTVSVKFSVTDSSSPPIVASMNYTLNIESR